MARARAAAAPGMKGTLAAYESAFRASTATTGEPFRRVALHAGDALAMLDRRVPKGVQRLWADVGSRDIGDGEGRFYCIYTPDEALSATSNLLSFIEPELAAEIKKSDKIDVKKVLAIAGADGADVQSNHYVVAMQPPKPERVFVWYHDQRGVFEEVADSVEAWLGHYVARIRSTWEPVAPVESRWETRFFITDGAGARKDLGGVLTRTVRHEETDFGRLYSFNDAGQWGSEDVSFKAAVSVAYLPEPGKPAWRILCSDGTCERRGKDGRTTEVVAKQPTKKAKTKLTDRRLTMRQIRVIDGVLHVLAAEGALFRRVGDAWTQVDVGFPFESGTPEWVSFDGWGTSALIAVGKSGRAAWHDGTRTGMFGANAPTDLHRVRCFADGTIYACGDGGTLWKARREATFGAHSAWQVVATGVSESLRDVEVFGNTTYVIGTDRLSRLGNAGLEPVVVDLDPPFEPCGSGRLHAIDGVLYVFGLHDIVRFDGTTWTRFLCPDLRWSNGTETVTGLRAPA